MKCTSKPVDANRRAWAVVAEATGQVAAAVPRPHDPAAVARGRAGGLARVKALSPERRREIAQQGAEARRGAVG